MKKLIGDNMPNLPNLVKNTKAIINTRLFLDKIGLKRVRFNLKELKAIRGMFMLLLFLSPVFCFAQENIHLLTICKIESNFNPDAYNKKSGARGLYQITEICLEDYVKENKLHYINPESLFDPELNTLVAHWYLTKRIPQLLKHYHKPITIENILWAYNAGIGLIVKGIMPRETINYIAKYKRLEVLK